VPESRELFRQIKMDYSIRSAIVHGMRLMEASRLRATSCKSAGLTLKAEGAL